MTTCQRKGTKPFPSSSAAKKQNANENSMEIPCMEIIKVIVIKHGKAYPLYVRGKLASKYIFNISASLHEYQWQLHAT